VPENVNREIRLASRPAGLPDASNFQLAETPIPEPGEGQALVRNVYMSVDPYMRGRMNDVQSYVPPFKVGEPLQGGAIGQVVRSNDPSLAEGDFVNSIYGWREYCAAPARHFTKIDAKVPLSWYLGILGMPGLTAYYGFLEIGQPKAGETVFVSGAAGAVGMVVCQLAKISGCTVVGSAGSQQKVDFLRNELGVDVAFNYKETSPEAALTEHCPNGIDIYFDNVGGDHLQAALGHLNVFGRIAACGSISRYNDTEPTPGPNNLFEVVRQRLTMKGFIISDHMALLPEFQQKMAGWFAEGKLMNEETVVQGIENAPKAFLGLFSGDNTGKMLVQLAPDPS
jgi:NADPH-dependent curcumin reductase CurA